MAAFHGIHHDAFQRLGEVGQRGVVVELAAVLQPAGPGIDRRDRVGRRLFALLVLAVMARDRSVRGLGFHDLAIGRHQLRCHQAQRAETLGHGVGLHVAVVVLAGPDIAARPLHRRRDHVVDQAVFVGDAGLFELVLELFVEDLLEQDHELAVVVLEDRVLGGEVDGIAALEAVVHRGAGEILDGFVEVIHSHVDAGGGRVEDLFLHHGAVFADEFHRQFARPGELHVGGAVLVAIGVAADHDGLGPARHEAGYVFADDRLPEDHAAEDVADGAVGAAPHLLEAEFLHPCFVRGDRRAFDADAVFLDRMGSVDGDLVIGLVARLDAEIVVLEIDVEIGGDQLLLDEIPDDPGHFIAVEFDDWVLYLDLRHQMLLWHNAFAQRLAYRPVNGKVVYRCMPKLGQKLPDGA